MVKALGSFMVAIAALAVVSTASANVWLVPDRFERIQWAIDDTSVHNGDTISVWGESVPPRIYNEYILCNKSLFIVNRSFLGVPGPNCLYYPIRVSFRRGDSSCSGVGTTSPPEKRGRFAESGTRFGCQSRPTPNRPNRAPTRNPVSPLGSGSYAE